MVNLTVMEKAVLSAIDNSEFGDDLCDPVWTFSIEGCVPKASLGGVIGSLVKKNLVLAMEIYGDDDATIEMTKMGADVYINEVNTNPLKRL